MVLVCKPLVTIRVAVDYITLYKGELTTPYHGKVYVTEISCFMSYKTTTNISQQTR
jgi:hypothetical protein